MPEITKDQLDIISGAFQQIQEAAEDLQKQHPESAALFEKIKRAIEYGTQTVVAASAR